ncbi:hypothetical protein REPUB_Repub02eG0183400 [Reevesia pubescens]
MIGNWTVPPEGILKVNTDASFNVHGKSAVLAMVGRISGGETVMAAVRKVSNVRFPLHAEMLAIQFGLVFCSGKGFESVIVESDSLETTGLLKQGDPGLWEGGSLIQNILD